MTKKFSYFIRQKIGVIPSRIVFSTMIVFTIVLIWLVYILFFVQIEPNISGYCYVKKLEDTKAITLNGFSIHVINKINIKDSITIYVNEKSVNNITLAIKEVNLSANQIYCQSTSIDFYQSLPPIPLSDSLRVKFSINNPVKTIFHKIFQ